MQARRRKLWVGLAAATLVAVSLASAGTAADDPSQAVRAAFQQYDDGWRAFDADKIVDVFAPDFDWTNSVGLRFTDRARFRRFLVQVFQDPDFRAGKPGPTVIRSVRLFGGDVAIVESRQVTLAQRDGRTHKVVPELDTDELTVFQRLDGRWLNVSDLTSDESHGI